MPVVIFIAIFWISTQITRILVIWPINVSHAFFVPRLLTLGLILGLFSWFFGE